ncbi:MULTISPECIES: SDR family NAD(P)-dependent oxidoreductase [unclassified Rhodococcus (in: high G+C Gram-positive bacteria)]|uniref:SDR family NAD(P)-dependent oxidoreductase n=1 Tax=unclassified Rhodococcus (in: high G+C Gram-positive bacteria) TaxID=192944 RepID=UPI00163A74CD|nr:MULTISPECIES: SDR family NAD(P)-dependent oxidoreductase [unclassified Rhodococcus (in: high G+C Gram-positive bacteria)]MBC2642823.1 SDR family NAD(P)-dependent oxidoreductase [Rhodococcus sp. 3A]MBC2892435.1 SDR family NAD(P)-dependent oxidoreductase [Rhodococcus sp. 4CII]
MTEPNDLAGRTMVVTGATAGLGLETCRQLARRGATVVLVGRDQDKIDAAIAGLSESTDRDRLCSALTDLSSLDRVRKLSGELLHRFPRIDVLINNAGVDAGHRQLTVDGIEATFAVNYLAPFVLATTLAPAMAQASTADAAGYRHPARIIDISSSGHRSGHLDLDDLDGAKDTFHGQRAYNNSKLALTLFTRSLAHRSDPARLVVNCADPGSVRGTTLGRDRPFGHQVVGTLLAPFTAEVAKGAETAVWTATATESGKFTGRYVKGCKVVQPSKDARDPELAARLWDATEALLADRG